MATATAPKKGDLERLEGLQLRVSPYERVASTLVALLIMVGVLVLMLAIVVVTSRLIARPPAIAVQLVDEFSGRGENPLGTEMDMHEPGVEEFPDLAEPRIEEIIQSVAQIVAADATSLDTLGTTVAAGRASGDHRRAGPQGTSDVIPRNERWEIAYPATTPEAYARQLDYFQIELGVIGGGRELVDYVSQFSSGQPRVWSSKETAQEKRLYFSWRSGRLQQLDRLLVSRTGVSVTGRQVLQFYPPAAEQHLAALELQAAAGRTARDILKTRFGVRPAGRGYEFYVQDIQFRTFR